jgi:hypothetical protein
MKKLFNLLLVALLGVVFLTSCDKDELDAPRVNFVGAPATAQVGDEVDFKVNIFADNRIKSVILSVDGVKEDEKNSGFSNPTSHEYVFKYTVKPADAGKDLEFEVLVTDRSDKSTIAKHTLKIEDVALSATFVDVPSTAKVGDKVQFKANVVAEVSIKKIEFKRGATSLATKTADFDSETEHEFIYEYDVQESDLGKTIEFAIIATDERNETVTTTHNLTVENGINSFTAKIMGAQSNATTGSFLATSNGTVYLAAAAATNASLIDFVYYHGATNNATIAAPNDTQVETVHATVKNWSKRNATKFKATDLTVEQFNAKTYHLQVNSHSENATSTHANQLTAGKVYAFVTEAGKRGLFHVQSISGTTAGTITINVKVEK